MVRCLRFVSCLIMVASFFLPAVGLAEATEAVAKISVEELKSRLGSEGLVVLDVRSAGDWNGSEKKIPGAVRVERQELEKWTDQQDRAQTIVLYCA